VPFGDPEIDRLKGTFNEIPGTKLTAYEAARLSGLEQPRCEMLLNALHEAGFLSARPDGSFVKSS
jgi:hypothetical protein